jgi:exodeoxyribonuclease V gamma subunit
VVRHPLQPFDTRNVTPGALGARGVFSHDVAALAGAASARGDRRPVPPFLAEPLAPCAEQLVALDELRAFLEHPVKAFLAQRLGLALFSADDDPADGLPLELSSLELWAVGDRLLRARLSGADADRCRQAEWRRGTLPPGPLGRALLAKLDVEIEPLVAAGAALRVGDPSSVDAVAALPGGRTVVGTVGGLHGHTLVSVEYSKLAAKHRLRAWVQLLALTVAQPEHPWQAVAVGRAQRGGPLRATLGPVSPGVAAAALADLVRLREEGLCEPLPVAAKTSHEYANAVAQGDSPVAAGLTAGRAWTGEFGEVTDAAHVLAWGADGDPRSDARFGDLATRVWAPLLAAERQERL